VSFPNEVGFGLLSSVFQSGLRWDGDVLENTTIVGYLEFRSGDAQRQALIEVKQRMDIDAVLSSWLFAVPSSAADRSKTP
jgi:hypothetical protein